MSKDKNQRPPANDEANMPKRQHQKATKRRKAVKLPEKQGEFEADVGNIKEAAQIAELSYDYARRLVTKSHTLEAIRNRQESRMGTPTNY